jgi:hypothetical protein
LPCTFPALSSVLLAPGGNEPAALAGSRAPDPAHERGVPALFSWGDVDGDGRLDLAAVSGDGALRLLASAGEGHFEDVTERFGLAGVGNARLALWADYDGDGRLDLFVGARAGASRLLRNEGGMFTDMGAASGLACQGAVQSAEWLDHDGDGRFDLLVVTAEENGLFTRLFNGLEGGFFERTELPLAGQAPVPGFGGSLVPASEEGAGVIEPSSAPGPTVRKDHLGRPIGGRSNLDGASTAGGHITPSPSSGSSIPILASCMPAIKDQANPSSCIAASTTPTLGRLYPISSNLFVALGGRPPSGSARSTPTRPACATSLSATTRAPA